jgi:hypothetical protein
MNEQNKRMRDEGRKAFAETCHLAQGTCMEVVCESVDHLIENYDPDRNAYFAHDFVFIMGSGFRGHDKRQGVPVGCVEVFHRGDLHMFSHVLAEHMGRNPEFASVIFHAIEVFCKQQCNRGPKDDNEEGDH